MNRIVTAGFLLSVLALSLAASQAFARAAPSPPPSGIVIHLWGPDSVTSHFLSTTPAAGGPSGSGTSTGNAPQANGAGGTAGGSGGTSDATANDPSWHDIAHQMFVTGDPSQEGAAALPKGKGGN